jgi:hypothetical protein
MRERLRASSTSSGDAGRRCERPAWVIASVAAATQKCVTRPWISASFAPRNGLTSKSFTLAAMSLRSFSVEKSRMKPTPLWPARSARQVVSTSFPRGETTPSPVTTTRLRLMPR